MLPYYFVLLLYFPLLFCFVITDHFIVFVEIETFRLVYLLLGRFTLAKIGSLAKWLAFLSKRVL